MNAANAKQTASCSTRSVMLYADGETDPGHILEIEAHLVSCQRCRDELDVVRAMRASVRRSVTRCAPSGLEAKLRAALADCEASSVAASLSISSTDARWTSAARTVEARAAERPERSRQWAVAAIAMAACFVLVVVVSQTERESGKQLAAIMTATIPSVASSPVGSALAANDESPNFDSVLDKLVALHANPLPPEEKDPEHLARLEPYVGVPVKRSALSLLRDFRGEGGQFDGARLHPLRDSRSCAALQYQMRGHRVTVYMFDPRVMSVGATRLTQRMFRENPVYVGKLRGFSVAAAEKRGVGYALASDMDEDKSLQLVASF